MSPQRVQVFGLGLPASGTPKEQRRYVVRWRVDGRDCKRRLKTRAEADRFRSQLLAAVAEGIRFDYATGLPVSWQTDTTTWWSWSCEWLALKWPRWAGSSRRSGVETLVSFTPHLLVPRAPAPPPGLTQWLREVGYNVGVERTQWSEAVWLDRWSCPLAAIDPVALERALTAATTRADGRSNVASVVKRRRDLVNAVLRAAVRRQLLDSNPMDRVEWSAPRQSSQVDVSVLPTMADVDHLVAAVASLRSDGARYAAFFATLAYAGLRPSEAAALRVADLELPESGWGVARLRAATPAPGTRYTDDGGTRQTKALKHRADNAVRSVPLAPPLVELLRAHLERWPSADLVFTNGGGRSVTPENYGKVWNRTKPAVWPRGHVASGAVPYDLRHTAATVMLRARVPLAEVSRRLGHSIDVLLRVYAGVFEDDEARSNEAIEIELASQRGRKDGRSPFASWLPTTDS